MKKKFQFTCRNCNYRQIIELDVHEKKENYKIVCQRCRNARTITIQFQNVSKNKNVQKDESIFSSITSKIGDFLDSFDSRIFKTLIIFLVIGFGFVIIALLAGLILRVSTFSPDAYLNDLNISQGSVILDRNGKVISELFDQKASTLKYEEIPKDLIDLLTFVEDESFFSHGGIDYLSIVRAAFTNLVSLRIKQGASTITQQLARILLNRREKTFARKLNEALLALSLESRYSKKEILTYYMNLVYLGHGAYGFQNAAKFYFHKNLNDLDFIERLVLVSLPSRPEFYSPIRNYDHLEKKMDLIFQRIKKEKKFDIDERTYELQKQSLRDKLNRSPHESVFGTRNDYAPYVTDFIRNKLEQLFGKESVYSGNLRIYTTIDLDLQLSASRETLAHVKEIRKWNPYKINLKDEKFIIKEHYLKTGLGGVFFGFPIPATRVQQLESASIGINPRTGEVLFMQGGSEFAANNQFNRALYMYRQTGSAIKPIIYSAGIEEGMMTPATIFEDSPIYFPIQQRDKDYWLPENIDESFEGRITLREAIEKSRNIPALMATQKIGIKRIGEQFRKFFFHTEKVFERRFKNEIAVGIGIIEMTPLEMALAFSVFANNGIMKRPFLIRKIENQEGQILYEGTNKDEFSLNIPDDYNVIPGDVSEVMISLLKSSVKYGGVGRGGFYSPKLAGKTGTTNQYKDAWFVGILPELVVSVWIGFDDHTMGMNRATGAAVAGPLYGKILKNVKEMYDVGEYIFQPRAKFLKFCPKSGKMPTIHCPSVVEELVPLSFDSYEPCDHHKPLKETRKNDFE